MKSILRLTIFVATAVSLFVASAGAHASIILGANLTNSQENPPTTPTLVGGGARPASFGFASFVINDALTAMSFTATIFNIDFTGSQTADVNDNLLNAHIHAGPTAVPGSNAPVVWGFFGSPFNDLNSLTPPFDCVAFATGVGGTCAGTWDASEGNGTTLTAQLPNILSGHSYINFHTTQFTGGEIRGALVVPEPSSLALLGVGALALFGFGMRRGRSRHATRF
jgi:hypothetical protein